jgi:hypothetical protein
MLDRVCTKRPCCRIHRFQLGDKINSGIALSYRHAILHGWRAGTATLCLSSQPGIYKFGYCTPVLAQGKRNGIFQQSMGSRNRVGIGLSYRPGLHRLAVLIPRLLKSLKIWALEFQSLDLAG